MTITQQSTTAAWGAIPAARDLAYTKALVEASRRLQAAADVSTLLRLAADEAVTLIPADGAAFLRFEDRRWQVLASRPSDAEPDDSQSASRFELLAGRSLLQGPTSVDDLQQAVPWVGLPWRSLLVRRIDGPSRHPERLAVYSTRPAPLSGFADVAQALAEHIGLALHAVAEREDLVRAVQSRHRIGMAQGILMTRRLITAERAFDLLLRGSQDSNVKLRLLAEAVIETGSLPTGRTVSEAERRRRSGTSRGRRGRLG